VMAIDAANAAVGKRQPKTKRGRRILAKRDPQVFEGPKSALLMKGCKASREVQSLMRDFHRIRSPLSMLYMRSHEEHPFEDLSKVTSLCVKHDHGLFVFGSTTKKRPFRIILGRLFHRQLLDMQEFNVVDYKSLDSFARSGSHSGSDAVMGSKPLLVFQGSAFENDERMKRVKSLLLDFFSGPRPSQMLLEGLSHVIVCSAGEPGGGGNLPEQEAPISVRRYAIIFKKASSKLPLVQLEEIGPSFGMTLDRTRDPDRELWKSSIKVPKAVKPKKVKNVKKDSMARKRGSIHLSKQDYDQIHTVHHGESKRRKLKADLKEKKAGTKDPAPDVVS